jgi:hypothetical protein
MATCNTRAVTSEVEQELDDRWWLGLRARTMESLGVHKFTVVLNFGEGSSLTIESAASARPTATASETPAVTLDENGAVSASDVLPSLVGQKVLSSVAFKTGALRLVFESGAILTVPYGEHFEAWQLTGPSGRMWVSLPGGGLATFPGDPS